MRCSRSTYLGQSISDHHMLTRFAQVPTFIANAETNTLNGDQGAELWVQIEVKTLMHTCYPTMLTGTRSSAPRQMSTLMSTPTANGIATVTFTPYYETNQPVTSPVRDANECTGNPLTFSLTVRATPIANIAGAGSTQTYCQGQNIPLTFTGTPNTTITYTVGGFTPTTRTVAIGAGGTGTATIVNPTTAVAVNLVSVAYTSGTACSTSVSGTVNFTPVPAPTGTLGDDYEVCSGINNPINLVFDANTGTGPFTLTLERDNGTLKDTFTVPGVSDNIAFDANSGASLALTTTYRLIGISDQNSTCPAIGSSFGSTTVTVVTEPNATLNITSPFTATYMGGNTLATPVNVCSETTFAATVSTTTPASDAEGNPLYLAIEVTAGGSFIGYTTGTTVYVPAAGFSINQFLDNNTGAVQAITGTIIPYYETNVASPQFNTGECFGETITFDMRLQPEVDPSMVSISISPNPAGVNPICEGGTTQLRIDGGPANADARVFIALSNGMVINRILNSVGRSTFNVTPTQTTIYSLQQIVNTIGMLQCTTQIQSSGSVTVMVEPRRTGEISSVQESLCTDDDYTFTFDATAGIGSSYEIGFEVNGGAANFTTLVDGGNFIVPSASFTAGVNTVVLTSIEDQGGSLNCVNTTVRDTLLVTVEPTPAVELSLTDDTGMTAPITSPFGPQGFCASMMNTLAFTADTTVTGAAPLTGRIYLSVTVDQDAANRLGFGAPGTYTRDVAGFDAQLAAIGLANAGTTNDTVIFSVTPYIETDTLSAPAGTAFNPAAECGGTPVEVNFFVYPAFTASIAGDQDACEGSSATLTILGPAGGTVDLTDGTTTSTVAINNLGIGSFTTPALTATTTYSLATATSSAANGSCVRPATGSVTVTVVPDPAAGLMITGPAGVICEGTSDTILVTGGPAAGELFYVIGAATTASVVTLDAAGEAKIPVAPTVTTTYTFDSVRTTTPIVCTSALTDVVTVTVNPAPAGTLSNSGAICNGGTVMFTYTDTTGNANGPFDLVISGESYTGIVDGTPFASTNPAPTVTTTYTLDTIVDMNGCGSLNVPADTTEVTVEDVPEITIDIDLPLDSNLTAANSSPAAPFSVTYCSGTRFLADAISSTLMSSAGDPLWIDLEIVDPGMLIGGNWSVRLPLASFILDTIPVNTSGVDQTFTMEFTPYYETMPMPGATVGAGECVGETILLSVTIQPQPTATITLADMTVCAGDSTDITLSGTPNAIVSLTGPNGNFTRTLDGMGNLVFSFRTVNIIH